MRGREEFKLSPRGLIERIAGAAWDMPYQVSSLRFKTLQDCIANGDPSRIKDFMLPGRYIMSLPADEREILKQLKPEDTIAGGNYIARLIEKEPRTFFEVVEHLSWKFDFKKFDERYAAHLLHHS